MEAGKQKRDEIPQRTRRVREHEDEKSKRGVTTKGIEDYREERSGEKREWKRGKRSQSEVKEKNKEKEKKGETSLISGNWSRAKTNLSIG